MYSDPDHLDLLENFQTWLDEECLELALKDGEPLEVCWDEEGRPLCYWKTWIPTAAECCHDTLVIDADFLVANNVGKRDLFAGIVDMVRHCNILNHIWIGGSEDSMARVYGLVSRAGKRKAEMATYIAGINVQKGHHSPPLVVTTVTSFGRGPSARTVRHQYV